MYHPCVADTAHIAIRAHSVRHVQYLIFPPKNVASVRNGRITEPVHRHPKFNLTARDRVLNTLCLRTGERILDIVIFVKSMSQLPFSSASVLSQISYHPDI